jgi:hypothetical protein
MTQATNSQGSANEQENVFGTSAREHQLNSSALVPIGGRLPYYQELRTGKILDFLISLFREQNKENLREKLRRWLYARTRPGFYVEIIPADLHLAYADHRDGSNSQHWWRLFFTERWKTRIETIANNTALTVSVNSQSSHSGDDEYFGRNENNSGFIEWGGMYFRSKTEVKIAEALYNKKVLFFANTRGQVSCQSSPLSNSLLPGRIEVDFLVFHQGKCMILEVDGVHHQEASQTVRDYARDRVLLREGIPTARFTADECFNRTEDVIVEFLQMLGATPTQRPDL